MNFRGLFLLTALTSAASLVQCYTFPEFSEKQHISFKEDISVSRHGISASASIRWGSGNPPRQVDYPFQNTSLPWDARVDDLVSRLSLQEIMVQMARGGAGEYTTPAPAIPRLGIPPYVWNSNCHRGDQGAWGNATAFPQSIGIAATFSSKAVFDVASVASIETRGKHNDFVKAGSFATHTGASCFNPMINVVRDPRWGRIQETYGEDPYMSGELAANVLKGLHGNHDRFVRVTGSCVIFDVYSGPENIPSPRESFDAKVTDEDMHMTYLPGFKKCVEAGTYSFMCSYNSINGVPACVNKKTMTDILRTAWKFKGYVVSDQGAIEFVISKHKYLHTHVDVAAAAVNAGCNLELSNNEPFNVFMSIVEAVKQGKLNESLVRQRVKPLFYTRMRLGQFDPPQTNPYSSLDSSVVNNPEHKEKALEVATKSFVLLKNVNNSLPLDPSKFKKVALIGPMADNYGQMFGNLPPKQSRSFAKTPLQGLKEIFPNLQYKPVCHEQTKCTELRKETVQQLSENKDLIIAALGTGPVVESEFHDRENLELPGHQKELLQDIIKYKGSARLVVLLFNAGPLNVTFADDDKNVAAILECFFPGQSTGDAIVNVLTNKDGKNSPAGRLPNTWPLTLSQVPQMVNYSMKGRTYRYMTGSALYSFGYGLSYTNFEYQALSLEPKVKAGQDIRVDLSVSNIGSVDSDEVIQCYLSWKNKSLPVPIRQLGYFERVHIQAGQQIQHSLTIKAQRTAYWKDDSWVISKGTMGLWCGGQQPDQRKSAHSNIVYADFEITDSITYSDDL
ncbi:hypothetical protein RRG08_033552 [Elysia crispata]|uniref:Fibronectin type III-like domain-containing protein n=1 Tax=Elysia crispata TaxID=231223 RepID=A0AAE0XNS8_9GAST|nr:hypothetical protein RRG08_033552 [Elysia crispata]